MLTALLIVKEKELKFEEVHNMTVINKDQALKEAKRIVGFIEGAELTKEEKDTIVKDCI